MILDDILAHKRAEVAAQEAAVPLEQVVEAISQAPASRGFRSALAQSGLSVIAEVKRKSPARGVLRPQADPVALASIYAAEGARAISVLTDRRFFDGSDADLQLVRAQVDLPVLRKDFVVADYQVWEARSIGADAILLIVRALAQADLERMLGLARQLGMDALVEVHNEAEVEQALAAGAEIVGINNRDLSSMTVSLDTTLRLRPMIPDGIVVVSESGIRSADDLSPLLAQGIDAILVGEALMSAAEPGAVLRQLVSAGVAA